MRTYCRTSKAIRGIRIASLIVLSITLVLSIGSVGFSIKSLTETGFVAGIVGSRELITTASVMLSIGAFVLITAPLGVISAMAIYPSVTLTYMILIFFMGLVCLVSGWLGYHLRREVESGVILKWMNYSLLYEYGNPFADDLTRSWDELHQKYACCGISDETDTVEWQSSHWFITYDRWPRPRVPASCCSTCKKGCYGPLIEYLRYHSSATVLISSFMVLLCLLNSCLCFLIHESLLKPQIYGEVLLT